LLPLYSGEEEAVVVPASRYLTQATAANNNLIMANAQLQALFSPPRNSANPKVPMHDMYHQRKKEKEG